MPHFRRPSGVRRPRTARINRVERLETRELLAGDTFAQATPLGSITTTPEAVSDTISPDTKVDMYRFSVASGQTVDFNINTPLNGLGGLGSFIRLFNNQGTQLAFNDDGAAPGETLGFDAYLRYTFANSGTYYLGVSNFNNTLYNPVTGAGDIAGGLHATGAYQLVVQGLPVDSDDRLTTANFLGSISATPITTSASINPDTDVDLYRFTASAGQTIDFNINTPLNGPGGLGSYLRLFNNQGIQVAFNNDAAAPGEVLGFDSYLRYTFTASGTYYLGVSNFVNTLYNPIEGTGDTAGGLNATGEYELVVNAIVPPTTDDDDTFLEANVVGAINSTPVTLVDDISFDTDVDMYRFTATAGQTIDFNVNTPLNGPNGLDSYLRLFNSLGAQIAFADDAAAGGESLGFDAFLRYTFANAGTYYIGVSNHNNILYSPTAGTGDVAGGLFATGAYTLVLRSVLPDLDGTLATATLVGPISSTAFAVSASIDPETDVDLYRFTVSAGQLVDFNINTPLNGPGGLGTYIRLFNSQGFQLAFNDDAAAPAEALGFDSYLRYTFPTAGTYYLGVSNFNNTNYNPTTGNGDTVGGLHAIGVYELVIQGSTTTAVVDPDDSVSEATPLGAVSTSPISRNDSLTVDRDVDMYAFTVNAGQTVEFNINTPLNGPNGLGSYIRLFNALGTVLAFNDDAAAPGESLGFDSYLRYTFADAGTYYIGVSSFNNTLYDPRTGNGDNPGGLFTTGAYQLVVQRVVTEGFPLHNFEIAHDVNDDGNVTALDALAVINYLNQLSSGQPPLETGPPFVDVNADANASASDALEVINFLNRFAVNDRSLQSTVSSATSLAGERDAIFGDPNIDFLVELPGVKKRANSATFPLGELD